MISAIVLAAGLSSRMGENKLLLKLGEQTVIEHVIQSVVSSHVDEIILVLGRDNIEISDTIEYLNVKTVFNPDYALGQNTSVKAGLQAISIDSSAALFFMGDQPFINENVIRDIIDNFHKSDYSIIAPCHQGKRGNPVMFSKKWYPTLMDIEGDKGGRDIIKNNPDEVKLIEVSDELFFRDVDTKEMYLALKRRVKRD